MTSPLSQFDHQSNGHLQAPSGPIIDTLNAHAISNLALLLNEHGPVQHTNDHGCLSTEYVSPGLVLDPYNLQYEIYEVDDVAIDQYDDLVREFPDLAISLEDIALGLGINIPPCGLLQFLPVSRTPDKQYTVTHPSPNSTVDSASHLSDSDISVEDIKKACTICRRVFDRSNRARDHAYKHLGLRPHCCGGQCGEQLCTFASWSEELRDRHLNRYAPCSWCGKVLTKKNMERHKKNPCPNRLSVITSH